MRFHSASSWTYYLLYVLSQKTWTANDRVVTTMISTDPAQIHFSCWDRRCKTHLIAKRLVTMHFLGVASEIQAVESPHASHFQTSLPAAEIETPKRQTGGHRNPSEMLLRHPVPYRHPHLFWRSSMAQVMHVFGHRQKRTDVKQPWCHLILRTDDPFCSVHNVSADWILKTLCHSSQSETLKMKLAL